jgi:protein gp37
MDGRWLLMSDHTKIEWSDASWNPIRGIAPNRHMCRKISPGCDHCYSSTMTRRFGGQEFPPEPTSIEVRLDEKALMLPLSWREPRRVFVCSMTDLFGEWVPQEWINAIFTVMWQAPRHQFQVLTKRPRIMRTALGDHYRSIQRSPLENVWLGTSIELDRFTWRANVLRDCPAAVRFVSAEPLLGPLPSLDLAGIDWLIAGGESGIGHRPCEPDWVCDLRDRSYEAHTAFFFKQWGGRTHAEGGRVLDGRTWDEYPRSLVTA